MSSDFSLSDEEGAKPHPDTFDLLKTIKRLERERDLIQIFLLVVYGFVMWWLADVFSFADKVIFSAVCVFGGLIYREIKDAHIQSLRVSLRHLTLLRDPEVARRG
jgi:hypothetical protein